MKWVLTSLILFVGLPLAFGGAQQSNSSKLPVPALTESQILGRRVFQQRCAVCHTQPTPGAKRYGPALYKELVADNEDNIREFIRNGSPGKMPGFKYGLESSEINAIVEYLKTLRRPARGGGGPVEEGPVD